ncbi:MAG: HD domain-containing protein, partial [Planctomycetota bacterium]
DIFDSFRNVPLRRLGALFLEDEDFVDDLSHAAAAVSHHHAYPGGLLQHTLDMMNLGKMLSPRYPGVDGEVVQFGAFLHDLGKMEELSIGNNASYTTRGQLLGHIVIGIQRLQDRFSQYEKVHGEPFPETLGTHLEHLICSHHGLVEYGSPRIPQTLEAVLLHHIDLLDAKMASATAFIQSDQSGDPAWTAYSQNLQRRFWKPDQDPGMP